MKLGKYVVQLLVLGSFTVGLVFFFMPSASATPNLVVECDNYVFVPLSEDGTWDCPPVDTSLIIPPGTIPGPDQVSPGGSHPFFNWNEILEWLFKILVPIIAPST